MAKTILNKNDFEEVDFSNYSFSSHLFVDLTGQTFGFLTIMRLFGYRKGTNRRILVWECKCICGKIRYCWTSQLKNSRAISCGCKSYEGTHANQKFDPIIAAYRAKVMNYQSHAKRDDVLWELTMEEAINLLQGNCHYCGITPSNTYCLLRNRRNKKFVLRTSTEARHVNVFYNGIDKIDSTKGYIKGNVVSCCFTCNTAKLEQTVEEFYAWIDRVIAQRIKNEISINQ